MSILKSNSCDICLLQYSYYSNTDRKLQRIFGLDRQTFEEQSKKFKIL